MKTTVLEDKLFKSFTETLANIWKDDLIAEAGKSLRKSNPCWKGYHPVGTKKKGGKTVPNCVPNEGVAEATPRHFGPKGAGTELARQIRANGELDRNKQPKPTGIPKKNEFNITEPKAKIQVKKDKGVAEDWNKVNHHDHTDGLSQKAVNAYRHEHPGSKLKTAVTTKPSKLKAGSKDAKRRKSFCARMSGNKGPMKDEKGRPTPKAKALRRWNCEE